MSDITPFQIAVPESQLADLKLRLSLTRFPDKETPSDWSQGIPLEYMQKVKEYWQNTYHWPDRQALLNRWPQFKTELQGLGIHFLHIRSEHEDARPLLMTHGWPGSIVEFQKTIEPLTNPTAHGGTADQAFHVVCPTLPGFGFSDQPTEPGWGIEKIARAWDELMVRLGYPQYLAQGGDW
ncbi:MAG: epoxide hydrolase family protein, partial [Pseudomonadales bacterium]